MAPLAAADLELIDRWQRDFPLVPRPYAHIARAMGRTELDVIDTLQALCGSGVLSRVGATVRPNTVGASLLAAMAVPPARLDAVARIVNAEAGVNHNYEREHAYNLWFVMTGRDRSAVAAALDRIRLASGFDILELPLERGYHIDLGFPLDGTATTIRACNGNTAGPASSPVRLLSSDRCLLEALEAGLAFTPRPYAQLGWLCGHSEKEIIARIDALIGMGVINRFGLILRHRALGFEANAIAVWDVDDAHVDAVGASLARERAVTLCYRRPRRQPHWPYNLFCMVHGRERGAVCAQIAELADRNDLKGHPHAILFSRRCFRQRGATLRATRPEEFRPCP